MSQDKNTSLLKRLKADDQSALKIIFQAYYPALYRAIYRLVSDRGIAEDLAQDVFMKFWEKRHQINIQGELGGYIRQMGVNEALGYIRKNKKIEIKEISEYRNSSSSLTSTSGEDLYINNELQAEVDKAIETLPSRCKMVFMLSRFEDLSHKEISEKLEISPKTVENQITKALKVLKKVLKSYLGSFLLFLSSFLFLS